MLSRFFIDRPIFATVLAIVLVTAGAVSMLRLPISQYPQITPPSVRVTTVYPGADAETVSSTVGQPIEEEVNGVEGMLYMSSTCDNNGTYALEVTFEVGTDIDIATVQVQNRISAAEPSLPAAVRQQGIITRKRSPNFVQLVTLVSPDGSKDAAFLQNYAILRVVDELSRIRGVGDVDLLGSRDYSMRIWVDPQKLRARQMTTADVVAAIESQNRQAAAGSIGRPPAPDDQVLQLVVTAKGRLETAEEFGNIVVRRGEDGRVVRVKDVARVELGVQSYDVTPTLNNESVAFLIIYQLPGANALDVAAGVNAKIDELRADFPAGVDVRVPYDATQFVSLSIREVVITLLISTVIVAVTIFIFLQDWRATIIPIITIPVSLIPTFAVLAALGLGINTITLLAMVLAIGIVVDDAIVVVENAARHISEQKCSARKGVIDGMREITGPVIATTLVLLAVFLPTLFLGGITGGLFLQFGITLSVATVFSSINALTLTPALCALLIKPGGGITASDGDDKSSFVGFRLFNRAFGKFTDGYVWLIRKTIAFAVLTALIYGGVIAASAWGFTTLPTGFVPEEDQGYAIMVAQLPDGASSVRTVEQSQRLVDLVLGVEGVQDVNGIPGFSFIDGAQVPNAASFFVIFEDWDARRGQQAIIDEINGLIADEMPGLSAFTLVPPAIRGTGNSGGFQMEVQDRGDVGLTRLQAVADQIIAEASDDPSVATARTTFRANTPQLRADVDRDKAETLDADVDEVYATLQAQLGSVYVNDFNLFGRVFQVRVQAEADARDEPGDVGSLTVRGATADDVVPLSTLVSLEDTLGPQVVRRFNLYPSAQLTGGSAPGASSGQALDALEQIAQARLPDSMGFAWSGTSFQERQAGGQAPFLLALAVFLVFLVLAAQYESWSLPLGVILAVPGGLVGAVLAVWLAGSDVNVYTQIGLVLLVALASKNAILIVEFAAEQREAGKEPAEAATEAARLRFRPILMTSLAFVFGMIPLVIASGAGAGSRRAIGQTAFGGEITAIVLTVLVVPSLYVLLARYLVRRSDGKAEDCDDDERQDQQQAQEQPA